MLSSPHSDALAELDTGLRDELARRLSLIESDLSPERAAARLKSQVAALGTPPPDLHLTRHLLLTTAAIALAALVALDRRAATR